MSADIRKATALLDSQMSTVWVARRDDCGRSGAEVWQRLARCGSILFAKMPHPTDPFLSRSRAAWFHRAIAGSLGHLSAKSDILAQPAHENTVAAANSITAAVGRRETRPVHE
eukprot:522700-Prymnesium_polylepis.2